MFAVLRESPLRILFIFALIGGIGLIYMEEIVRLTLAENNGHIGALLDDTWIHVRFADSVSQGNGLSYNQDTLTTGATSPLWVMLLAVVFAIFQPDVMQQVDIAIVMSAIGYLLSGWAIAGFGWWVTRNPLVGLWAGLLTMLTGRFLWMGLSGMEITTFTFLVIMAIWSHAYDVSERRPLGWRTGILTALATLARPEAYLLMGLIGLDSVIVQPWRDFDTREERLNHILKSWRGMIAYIILAGSYPLTTMLISGHPLPNTFRAKSALGREFPDLPHAFFWAPNNEHGIIMILLAGIGIALMLWQSRQRQSPHLLWTLWPVLFVLGVLFLGAQRFVVNNSRYVAPSIPFHALLAVIGLWAVVNLVLLRWPGLLWAARRLNILLVALAVMVFLRGLPNARGVAHNVAQLRTMHVALGKWVEKYTPPDQPIALNDVGAIVHISDREVLDLEGLVSPEVIEATAGLPDHTCEHDLALARLILAQKPSIVAVFPWFYPCLTGWPDALIPQTMFTIEGETVIAGGEMVVYSPNWAAWPMQETMDSDAEPVAVHFEKQITLRGYSTRRQENGLEVTLWWESGQRLTESYHVFVHLIDENGEILAQHDSRPQQDRFETWWWRAGDLIPDPHLIVVDDPDILDQEGLQLQIGLYRFEGFGRLQRTDPDAAQPDLVRLPVFNDG